MKKSKFLIIGQLPPPVHGSNVMTAFFMKSLMKLGYEVDIVQKNLSKTIDELKQFSLYKILQLPIIGMRLIRQILRKTPVLCFYFNTVTMKGLMVDAFFIVILKILKVPYIFYSHGNGLRELYNAYHCRLHSWMVRSIIVGATGAIVLGESLKDDLRPFLDDQKLFVLPNAISDIIATQGVARRQEKPLINILFLSNLSEDKGPMEFLIMAKKVLAKINNVRFILAGPKMSDNFYQKLVDFIEHEGLENFIKLPGGLYGEAKQKAFLENDIFVFPSHREAFPLVILEAMHFGLPVITSAEGAIPEMVIDGESGYIVNPADIYQLTDRVLRLVRDPELRDRMGEEGRKRYEQHFTIEVYEKNLYKALEFFQGVLDNPQEIQ